MLKAQDVVLLLKILTGKKWSQNQIALHLCMSVSEVNAGVKRLMQSGLLRQVQFDSILPNAPSGQIYLPIIKACEEFLIIGVKYFFPAEVGPMTVGIATSYAAPIFEKRIMLGQDPIPVWPYAEGDRRGFTLEPLYSSVPKAIAQYPDEQFYELLTLIDALRHGRARERNIATKLLKERLNNESQHIY